MGIKNHVGKWLRRYQRFLGLLLLGLLGLQLVLDRVRLVTLQGEAMGARYSIKYLDRWGRSYQEEIESILRRLEQALSTSLPESELSRFNAHDCSDFCFESPFFYPVFAKSKAVYGNTSGAFDPTILPLVNAWEVRAEELDSQQINTLRGYVSLDYVVANEQRIKRLKEGVKLDFRGILKGYAVDQIVALLRTHGIKHAWIALGNELIVEGKPKKGQYWYTAIHPYVPALVKEGFQITMEMVDKAVAISSQQPKERPACVIDPATGYPPQDTLLAAIVIAPDSMSADAYATAMMARGLAYAQELVAKQEDLAVFLIYEDDSGALAFYASSDLAVKQKERSIKLSYSQEIIGGVK